MPLLALREYEHASTIFPFGSVLHYTDARSDLAPERIAHDVGTFLAARGFDDATVAPIAPTVEDTFMARMGAAGEAV